ncbi:VMA9 [Brettanomyces bruxellensis]|uniref:DEBR0S6_11078g1_1 n=1 Tax=Dekkera bruxellensis TaxID=5007 RepID=A0A7D9D197_DEKBR|nr:VMA9 [Brettanomyces bruxellensis]
MSGWTVIIVLIANLVAGSLFWRFAPKQDRTVWRSTVSLMLAMMYLMWAFTYLCQLHPLIEPRRSDLRPEFAEKI